MAKESQPTAAACHIPCVTSIHVLSAIWHYKEVSEELRITLDTYKAGYHSDNGFKMSSTGIITFPQE